MERTERRNTSLTWDVLLKPFKDLGRGWNEGRAFLKRNHFENTAEEAYERHADFIPTARESCAH